MRTPCHFGTEITDVLTHIFGEIEAMENLLDTANDDIGLTLMDAQLPKRVRHKAGTSGAL
jgi:hypothetical protein